MRIRSCGIGSSRAQRCSSTHRACPKESIDEIYASHVFEHVPQKKIISTLSGINRVLKTGGKFYVSVPDINVLFKFFLTPLKDYAAKIGKTEGEIKMHVLRMIFGGQTDDYDLMK